jgi:acyl-CoA synthetase (AMP-forming)/AMP-acid ligase II/thioesterase domain-containing protein
MRHAPESIRGLVGSWAERAPDAAAISGLAGRPLTYGELRDQLARTEHELREVGIGPGARVALVLDNGPELACAFLGVAAAAGCAPLNPAYRANELDFYLSDLRASAVIVAAGARTPARDAAERTGALVLELEPSQPAGAFRLVPQGSAVPADAPDANGVALLLHTSGTTARPKLVPLTHENLCASATSVAGSLALTPEDRCLAVMPLFHIHGLVASVLAPLAAGSSVVATPGFDGVRFLDWVEATRPTWYTAVPTMHMSVLERVSRRGRPSAEAGLRLVRSSSAALPTRVLAELEEAFGCPVIEAYGMTEAAHQMASNPLPPGERKPGSVGLPAGPEIAVLDASGRILEAGEVGEVAVRGPSVFGGYEGNPEATREAFSNGWFRTGDEGFVDADGYLFLRGRLKEVVNRGGEKVAPREVEEILLAHPGVADAVVFAQPHESLGEEVAAAVVLRSGAEASASELQEFASSRLAPFKVPRTIVFRDELPKGPTGKVQRIGLADRLGLPMLGTAATVADYVEPRDALERRLCELFGELLDVPRVGIDDDFFALGGESLHVAQLLSRIDEEHGREEETPVWVLLRAPTPRRLAALLREGEDGSRVVPVGPERSGAPLFFFPTHEWETVGFGALAQRLDGEHAVCTFQPDLHQLTSGSPSMTSLAATFAADVRTHQARGPYYLGGHCFGAGLALEVARILRAENEEIAALVLLNPIGEHPRRSRIAARWIVLHARRGTLHRWVGRRLRRPATQQTRVAPSEQPVVHKLSRAGAEYVPAPYPGPATILASADYLTPQAFWTKRVGAVTWVRVPGYTDALFRAPFVDALAEQLSLALRPLPARPPEPPPGPRQG